MRVFPRAAADRAGACLDHAISSLTAAPASAALYSGFTGVAWAAGIVDGLLGTGGGDRNETIDAAVTSLLHRDLPGSVPYDLVNGLTGLGVYALARWPDAAGPDCLAAVVRHLARRARRDGDGGVYQSLVRAQSAVPDASPAAPAAAVTGPGGEEAERIR